MWKNLKRFLRCQNGTTSIEYAFIAALVSTGIIVALNSMTSSLSALFDTVSSTLSGAAGS